MVNRTLKPSKSNSFFLFGPRGSGKSTLLKTLFPPSESILTIDLLNLTVEDRYRTDIGLLEREIIANKNYEWVIIDEVQKLPRLLDAVHSLIESTKVKFALSGSSARKLKRGGANLLAGRAFVYHLYPFSVFELDEQFDLQRSLEWGMLPKVWSFTADDDRLEYLHAYALTYLKEEIQLEQIVRNLEPFRLFLQIAAQTQGKVLNYSKIARQTGVDTTTVQNYYSILDDTLIGFTLSAYHTSIRKRQIQAPKFYFLDGGITRSLSGQLDVPLRPGTSAYGDAFEAFVMLEIRKNIDYFKKTWRMSYLLTKDDSEIDLIIERPGKKTLCIEIKSTDKLIEGDLTSFVKLSQDVPNSESICLSRDLRTQQIAHVKCQHWLHGMKDIFASP